MSYNDSYFTALRKYAQSGLIGAVEIHTKENVICLTEKSKVFFDFTGDNYTFTDALIGDGENLSLQLDPVESITIKSEDINNFAI